MTIPNWHGDDIGMRDSNRTRFGLLALGLGSRVGGFRYYDYLDRMPLVRPPSRRVRIAAALGLNWYPDWNTDGSDVSHYPERTQRLPIAGAR